MLRGMIRLLVSLSALLHMLHRIVDKRADMLCRMGWIDGQAGDTRRRFGHHAPQTRSHPLRKDQHSSISHGKLPVLLPQPTFASKGRCPTPSTTSSASASTP
jgi:hypothetical protein